MSAIRGVWAPYLQRYAPVRWGLLRSVLLLMAQSGLVASIAFFVKAIFDGILHQKPFGQLLPPSLAILACVFLGGFLARTARQSILRITKIVIANLRAELLDHAWRQTHVSADERTRLHSLIVHDTERVDVMSNTLVSIALPAGLTASILVAALLAYAPLLLVAVLCVAPLSFAVSRILGRMLKRETAQFHDAFEAFSQGVLTSLRRMPLTRALGAEQLEAAQRAGQIETLRQVSGDMSLTATTYNIAQNSVTALASLATLLAGGAAVLWGHMSLGALAAAYVIVTQLGGALNGLWNSVPHVISGHRSLVEIDAILSRPGHHAAGGKAIHTLQGQVEFRDLSFSYDDAPLLTGLDLHLAPGGQAAIMGANGAGKSTLVQLLLGFYPARGGAVLIDGAPVGELSLGHLRRQIGVVLQEPLLFDGTVTENIAYGRPGTKRAAIEAAAMLTGADRFIRALPQGYDTRLGAGGAVLSGGQCQLLAVTRALLGEPKLLVLDEPSNHLDGDTAQALCRTLKTLPFRPTILLITHDAAVARNFPRVLNLRHGRLLEQDAPESVP